MLTTARFMAHVAQTVRTAALSAAVSACSTAIADWMASNRLQLNADKYGCDVVRVSYGSSSSLPVAPVIISSSCHPVITFSVS
jgi:hypothetical protein